MIEIELLELQVVCLRQDRDRDIGLLVTGIISFIIYGTTILLYNNLNNPYTAYNLNTVKRPLARSLPSGGTFWTSCYNWNCS